MREWLISYGSWCLAPFGLLGMYVVGRKKSWGWLLSMGTQALWAVYAVGTAQFGFLIGTCSYFGVYLRNWLGWRKGPSGAPDPVLAALRAVYADLDATGRAGDEWAYEWVHECWPALVPLGVRIQVGDPDAADQAAEDPAAAEVAALVAAGRADDLVAAYSTHGQSCAYVAGIIDHVADEGSAMTAQQFARSLQEESAK